MNASTQHLTLLLFASPDWRVRLFAFDDDWHMYRYPEPEDTELARKIAHYLQTVPFTVFPEQRAKATQAMCEPLRDKPVQRDRDSERKLRRLRHTLRLSGIYHPYVLPHPGAVNHLGVPYVELDDGFRAYPVGEFVPQKKVRGSEA